MKLITLIKTTGIIERLIEIITEKIIDKTTCVKFV